MTLQSGPISKRAVLVPLLAEVTDVPLSAQPNAGGPQEVEGRRLVLSSPEFLASYARRYVAVGVGLVGGCCGTTPAHIARIKHAVVVGVLIRALEFDVNRVVRKWAACH